MNIGVFLYNRLWLHKNLILFLLLDFYSFSSIHSHTFFSQSVSEVYDTREFFFLFIYGPISICVKSALTHLLNCAWWCLINHSNQKLTIITTYFLLIIRETLMMMDNFQRIMSVDKNLPLVCLAGKHHHNLKGILDQWQIIA